MAGSAHCQINPDPLPDCPPPLLCKPTPCHLRRSLNPTSAPAAIATAWCLPPPSPAASQPLPLDTCPAASQSPSRLPSSFPASKRFLTWFSLHSISLALQLISRTAFLTESSSPRVTRSVLFSRIRSANASCCAASLMDPASSELPKESKCWGGGEGGG